MILSLYHLHVAPQHLRATLPEFKDGRHCHRTGLPLGKRDTQSARAVRCIRTAIWLPCPLQTAGVHRIFATPETVLPPSHGRAKLQSTKLEFTAWEGPDSPDTKLGAPVLPSQVPHFLLFSLQGLLHHFCCTSFACPLCQKLCIHLICH